MSKKPTTIRPDEQLLARIEYLKQRLELRTMAQVLWHCVNRVYRDEVKLEHIPPKK